MVDILTKIPLPAVELAAKREDITSSEDAISLEARAAVELAEPEEVLFETPFDYLFPELTTDPAAHLPADDPAKIAAVVAGLKALGDVMVEDSLAPGESPLQPTGNSIIPPVYTYWGQFIDHDLTANTDRWSGSPHGIPPLPEFGRDLIPKAHKHAPQAKNFRRSSL